MARYAVVTHLDSAQRFVVLIEDNGTVDTIGISKQGKEWERWADALPEKNRSTIEQLTVSLGPQVTIDGPSKLTTALRVEFDALAAEMGSSIAKIDGVKSRDK